MIRVYNNIDMDAPGLQMVLSLTEMDSSILSGLIDSVIDNTPKIMNHLKIGVENKSISEIKISAHSLKSSFNLIGAIELGNYCQELENMSILGSAENAELLFIQIQFLYNEVLKDLYQWKKDLEQ